jgi:CBS domain-containing protein
MTDFRKVKALTVMPHISIDEALEEMKWVQVYVGSELCSVHVCNLLVTDEAREIIGLITSEDIRGEKPIEIAHDRGIRHTEVTVEMLMIPLAEISALDIVAVRKARVADILETMREGGCRHLLVVEQDEETKQRVRGVFSRSQICRQLAEDVKEDVGPCHSFAELAHELG